jgi:GT2 family glycosyltransferase
MNTCNISVVIPTYNRSEQLLEAIAKILACDPQPDEIIVHIDGGDNVTEQAIQNSQFQDVLILKSSSQVGPGGGRNKAIARAKHEIVASFDDDSYPIDTDYFARLLKLFERFPKAAVIGAAIYHLSETIEKDTLTAQWEHSFVGCGCAYRKDVFQATQGYVELPVAYGMEEVDLSLRLHDLSWGVLITPWLRVFHHTELKHHNNPKITAASISNQILLTYLRYPPFLWWIGFGQCLNRIVWLIKHQRFQGIVRGIANIPQAIYTNGKHRKPVTENNLKSFLALKRNPSLEELTN